MIRAGVLIVLLLAFGRPSVSSEVCQVRPQILQPFAGSNRDPRLDQYARKVQSELDRIRRQLEQFGQSIDQTDRQAAGAAGQLADSIEELAERIDHLERTASALADLHVQAKQRREELSAAIGSADSIDWSRLDQVAGSIEQLELRLEQLEQVDTSPSESPALSLSWQLASYALTGTGGAGLAAAAIGLAFRSWFRRRSEPGFTTNSASDPPSADPGGSVGSGERPAGPVVRPEVRTQFEFVGVERDNFRRAYDWARKSLAGRYPGSTDHLEALDSLVQQHLTGQPPPNQ